MLKTLIRKQLFELKYMYFKDKKTGQLNTGKKAIGIIGLFVFIFISCAFAFYGMSILFASTLFDINVHWLYYVLMGLIAIVAAMFATMFMAYSTIYAAKDNDLLLSMPIQPEHIVIARLISQYINILFFVGIVWLPTMLCAQLYDGFNFSFLIGGIVMYFVIAGISLFLSCLLGYVIGIFNRHFKNKSFITLFISVLFIGLYYVFYFNISKYLNKIVENIGFIQNAVLEKYRFLFYFGKAACGDVLSLVICAIVSIVFVFVCYKLIASSFVRVVTSSGSGKKKAFNNKIASKNSPAKALFKKELARFTSNATYMMNCGLGLLVCIVTPIVLYVKKDILMEMMTTMGFGKDYLAAFIIGAFSACIGMDAIATPAVSLEGNNYWIVRTTPVRTLDVLNAKRNLQFVINVGPMLIGSIATCIILDLGIVYSLLIVISLIISLAFYSSIDLVFGITGAKLEWTSEVVAIKQNLNVLLALFISWVLGAAQAFIYLFASKIMSATLYITLFGILLIILTVLTNIWIIKKGTIRFEELV